MLLFLGCGVTGRKFLMFSAVQYHQSVIDNAREAERQYAGRPLAIALDTVSLQILVHRGVTSDSLYRKDQKYVLVIPMGMQIFQFQLAQK